MNLLILFGGITLGLFSQLPENLRSPNSIDNYVKDLNSKKLVLFQLWRTPLSCSSGAKGRDSIFFAYATDFPCSATIYYSGGNFVKIKEVISESSTFAVNYYFLKNNRLVFVEGKEVICPFNQQSPRKVYTEKDYSFHSKHYFSDTTVIKQWMRGERRIAPSPGYFRGTPAHFLIWQSKRYTELFAKSNSE